MSGIASITPVWQQVKPTDVSRYIDGMAESYNRQNQVIKDQIKVFDTALANAQQAKMNEVQRAMDSISLDRFQSADGQASIDQIIRDAAASIGGFNASSMKSINDYRDKRGDVLVDKAVADLTYQDKQYKYDSEKTAQEMLGLKVVADDPTNTQAPENRQAAQTALDAIIASSYDPNSGLSRGQRDAIRMFTVEGTISMGDMIPKIHAVDTAIGKALYDKDYAGVTNGLIHRLAETTAMLDYLPQDAPERPALEQSAKDLVKLNEALIGKMPTNVRNYYGSIYGETYNKYYKDSSSSVNARANWETKQGALDLQRYIAENGSYADKASAALGLAKQEWAENPNNPDNQPKGTGSSTESPISTDGKDRLKELGISNAIVKGSDGSYQMNWSNINSAINNQFSKPLLSSDGKTTYSQQLEMILSNPKDPRHEYAHGSEWGWGGSRLEFGKKYLNEFTYTDPDTGKVRKLNSEEKDYLMYQYLNAMGGGNWFKSSMKEDGRHKEYLAQYHREKRQQNSLYLRDVISAIAQYTNLSEEQIIGGAGLDKKYRPYLTASQASVFNKKDSDAAANASRQFAASMGISPANTLNRLSSPSVPVMMAGVPNYNGITPSVGKLLGGSNSSVVSAAPAVSSKGGGKVKYGWEAMKENAGRTGRKLANYFGF